MQGADGGELGGRRSLPVARTMPGDGAVEEQVRVRRRDLLRNGLRIAADREQQDERGSEEGPHSQCVSIRRRSCTDVGSGGTPLRAAAPLTLGGRWLYWANKSMTVT